MPHADRPLSDVEQRALPPAARAAQLAMRAGIYWAREPFVLEFRHPRLGAARSSGWRSSTCASRCRDPELRAQADADYAIGCKRILLSDD